MKFTVDPTYLDEKAAAWWKAKTPAMRGGRWGWHDGGRLNKVFVICNLSLAGVKSLT